MFDFLVGVSFRIELGGEVVKQGVVSNIVEKKRGADDGITVYHIVDVLGKTYPVNVPIYGITNGSNIFETKLNIKWKGEQRV